MSKNQQSFPQRVTRKTEISADAGQQKPVEVLLLEKKDCNKSKALVLQDKDENGLELSLGLMCGRSQCKSSNAYAQRNMSGSQESPNDVNISKTDGLGASSSSFLEENAFQLFRDGGSSSQARRIHELDVSKSFLVDDRSEHEIHMLTDAGSCEGQDFNKKLLEEKEKPFSNGRTQSISCPLGAESWSFGKNNGEEDKSRALWQQPLEIQERVRWTGHASAPTFKSTASMSSIVVSQAGLLPAINLASRSGTEIGSLSSARQVDFVSVSDAGTIHLASNSKGAELYEILQQHGIPELHMPGELHLHKQREVRKKRRMLIDEQKQQKKAKEDEQSLIFNGASESAKSQITPSKEEPAHLIVQCSQTQSQSGIMKPGMVATTAGSTKLGSHGILPSSELNFHREDSGNDAFTNLVAAAETSQGMSAALAAISGTVTGLSVGKNIKHEETALEFPRDGQDETAASGINQLEIVARLDKLGNDTRLLSENFNGKSAAGFWQMGTTRDIPAMESLAKEPYNLQPGMAVGQTFGGTGFSPDLPWVSSPSLNGKAVSGVVYRLHNGPSRIVCACHGKHMTPAEFSAHTSSFDLPETDATLVMCTFSDVAEATPAEA